MTKLLSTIEQPIPELSAQSPPLGAYIDAEGREIPITERMILEACRCLEGAASTIYPRKIRRATVTG